MADIKVDLRELRGTLERRFEAMDRTFDALDTKFSGKLDAFDAKLDDKLNAFNAKFTRLFVWLVSGLLGLGAAILGAMAKGFHWL